MRSFYDLRGLRSGSVSIVWEDLMPMRVIFAWKACWGRVLESIASMGFLCQVSL